jgi:hypothetical protein
MYLEWLDMDGPAVLYRKKRKIQDGHRMMSMAICTITVSSGESAISHTNVLPLSSVLKSKLSKNAAGVVRLSL